MEDRLRVNKLALQVPAWVALAVARLTEVPGHLGVPSSFAVCAAILAFGDELLVQKDDDFKWGSPGGREVIGAIDQGLRRLDSELQETSQGREHY